MPCDERYRAWAMRQGPAADAAPPELYPGRLVRVTGCMARPGSRELHFDVAGTTWSWCFPGAARADTRDPRVRALILQPGPHGPTAQAITAGTADCMPQPGWLDLTAAADLAISGVPVFIHRFLLRQQTGQAAPGPQPIELGRK
jgi:hypothetical protein